MPGAGREGVVPVRGGLGKPSGGIPVLAVPTLREAGPVFRQGGEAHEEAERAVAAGGGGQVRGVQGEHVPRGEPRLGAEEPYGGIPAPDLVRRGSGAGGAGLGDGMDGFGGRLSVPAVTKADH